jgi:predicted GTPase
MSVRAAALAARRLGATLVDPRPWAEGSPRALFAAYPALGPVLPAMGSDPAQRAELDRTSNAVRCDVVLLRTPMDLRRNMSIRHPVVRARYEVEDVGDVSTEDIASRFSTGNRLHRSRPSV